MVFSNGIKSTPALVCNSAFIASGLFLSSETSPSNLDDTAVSIRLAERKYPALYLHLPLDSANSSWRNLKVRVRSGKLTLQTLAHPQQDTVSLILHPIYVEMISPPFISSHQILYTSEFGLSSHTLKK